jgi:hypothetical protein
MLCKLNDAKELFCKYAQRYLCSRSTCPNYSCVKQRHIKCGGLDYNVVAEKVYNEDTIHNDAVRNRVTGTAGYGPDDRGSRVRFLVRAGNFSLLQRVQNGTGASPASYPMGTRGSFLGCKAAGA